MFFRIDDLAMALWGNLGRHLAIIDSKRAKISYFSELDTRASNSNANEDINKWSNCNNGNAELMLESHIICFPQGY